VVWEVASSDLVMLVEICESEVENTLNGFRCRCWWLHVENSALTLLWLHVFVVFRVCTLGSKRRLFRAYDPVVIV